MKWYVTTEANKWIEKNYTPDQTAVDTGVQDTGLYDQTIDGFGGCFNELGFEALSQLPPQKKEAILDDLFLPEGDGLRLNFCRTPIGASDYALNWYSYSPCKDDFKMEHFTIERDREYLLPYIQSARKRNPRLEMFSSPWSPPEWMKFPAVYNYGKLIWTPENLNAYALYFVKYIEAYAKEGVPIRQIHVQNEPVSTQKFPSCIWTGDEFAEFIGKYLGPALREHGLDTEIWLGTINGPETDHPRAYWSRHNDYASLVLHDKMAAPYISGVSYQWAGKYAVDKTHRDFPEYKLLQSENECGDSANTWAYARYINELFLHYLSHGVNGYVYWNMVLREGGESSWGWKQNSMITIDPEKGEAVYQYEYYIMKHYARFIQKGARRKELRGHWSTNSVLFENPDQSHVLVCANPFRREMHLKLDTGVGTYTFRLEPDSIHTMVF